MQIKFNRSGNGKGEKGQILVIVVAGIVALLICSAIVIDYGLMVADANRLQRACDAAALAGAQDLDGTSAKTSTARTSAKNTASANGFTIADSDITFSNGNLRMRVQGSTQRSFLFGPLLGANSGTVSRHATAENAKVGGLLGGGAPIAISFNDFVTLNAGKYTNTTKTLSMIRNQDTDFNDGNLIALSVQTDSNGKSTSAFQNAVTNGTDANLTTGDHLDIDTQLSLNASLNVQKKSLEDGLAARSSMYMTVAVIDNKSQTNGNSYHTIRGVVGIEVTSYNLNGRNNSISIRVLKPSEISLLNLSNTGVALLTDDEIAAAGGSSNVADTNITTLRLVDDL